MHVADVTMFYAPQGGGVRRYIEAKRAWLLRRGGCAHTLLVPRSRKAPAEAGLIALSSMPLPLSHGYRVPLGRAQAARRLIALAPSVIEAGDPYTLAWAALDAGRALGVPVVGFCHSDLPRLMRERYGRRAERLAALYCARLYGRFDLVLAPSRATAERLRAWGVTSARHQPLGVDVSTFHPDRRDPQIRHQLGLAPTTRLLVYTGRFAPEKNLDVLADAMRKLGPRYVALLAGAGALPSALPSNVRVLPYIPDRPKLATLIASCDVFVHPGDQETFGLAALEALACGVPVVGAHAAGLAELVTPEAGLLVAPRSPAALAHGVAALFDDDIAERAVGARQLAERYAWNHVLASLLECYTALARTVH